MRTIAEFYEQIYNLSHIQRYSVVPRIKSESVAEHSFFVASLVIKLHEKYDFDMGKAVVMAVTHDWTESWLDDITVATKRKFPEIAEAVNICERKVAIHEFNLETYSAWIEYKTGVTIEAKIVQYADVLQCIQYSQGEVNKGNIGYMQSVLDTSKERAKRIKNLLSSHRKP